MSLLNDMPETTPALAAWIERMVVSLELADFVEEIESNQLATGQFGTPDIEIACDPNRSLPDGGITLQSICGKQLPQALQEGLGCLNHEQLVQLLDHPHLLFDLQEQAFLACSPYWDRLVNESAASAALVAPQLKPTRAATASAPTASLNATKIWAMLALAATVLLAVGYWNFVSTPQEESASPSPAPIIASPVVGWGLATIDSLDKEMSESNYLKTLGELAGQWGRKRPSDALALSKRLREFRIGCQALIDHPKPQLKDTNKKWLVAECQKWLKDLDRVAADLDQQKISFEDALAGVDAIAESMSKALLAKSSAV